MLIKFEVNTELSIIRILSLHFERLKQVSYAVRGECRLAKDAHDFNDRPSNLEVMLYDGNEAVCDDGNMYLDTYCILGFTPKAFDLKMLLNPLEKQLHLPSILVEQGDVLCTEKIIVCVIDKATMQFRSIIHDSPDCARILLHIFFLCKANTLVFEHIVCAIKDAFSIDDFVSRPAFLPDDEEGSEYMNLIETGEIKVASVKHIAGKSLVCEPVHGVDFMHLCIGNSIEYRYLRCDVNLRMYFDARLGTSELSPSKHGHAEVDGCGVDGIEPTVQFKLLRDTLGLGNSHHVEGKLFKDTMVSEKIGLREHLPIDWLIPKAEMFGLLTMGGCYICELSESSAVHKLTEYENQHVAPMRHRPALGPVVVLGEDSPEMPLWEELRYLCKNVLSNMHTYYDFESSAKIRISKPGQSIGKLKHCA